MKDIMRKIKKIMKEKPPSAQEMRRMYLEAERNMIVHWIDDLIGEGMTTTEALRAISNFVFGKTASSK
jgi:hypothetical protein